MQLNPQAFNAHLGSFAEPFQWRRAFACPCLNPATGAPRANCPGCSGKGRLWMPAVDASAAVASTNVQQQWARFGQFEQGDKVLSIPENSPLYDLMQYDRLTALTDTEGFSTAFIHGSPTERVHGKILEFSRCFWFSSGSTIVEGGLPTLDADGVLTWAAGEPPANKEYSLTGTRYQEFYCWGSFSVDRMKHGGLRLPRRMVVRRFDLLGRAGSK